jgi:hypothetical protein
MSSEMPIRMWNGPLAAIRTGRPEDLSEATPRQVFGTLWRRCPLHKAVDI